MTNLDTVGVTIYDLSLLYLFQNSSPRGGVGVAGFNIISIWRGLGRIWQGWAVDLAMFER